jgi:16S rRNA (cytidine1402-2'-O)-methyltransferase
MNKGNLYLIPNTIAEGTHDKVLTPQLKELLPGIQYFVVENIRTARRFLSSLKIYQSVETLSFSILDKDTAYDQINSLFEPLFSGRHAGIISEAGCPGIADPGALAVKFAHENDIKVVPLVGPSSILLALMASGLNGQNFAFHGYMPIDSRDAISKIRELEKESAKRNQTQILIETPYRNNSLLNNLIKALNQATLLTIATDITGASETIRTRTIGDWKSAPVPLAKSPTVFLFLA